MLIYLAELLFANPSCTKEFARVFNDTFSLFKDNLGTFGHILTDEAEKYDLFLSNPPYVTSGSSIIKDEIRRNPRTATEYPVNAFGLEGLSLEWLVKSLKKGGKAFVIIPDGVLCRIPDRKLRRYILAECYLDAIVSLPVRTFFANAEHTYILAITKKNQPEDVQKDPVFTYLVTNIGERLTSVKREEIDADDLPEMERLFRLFCAARGDAKDLLEQRFPRCKIQAIDRFREEANWLIDRWWTRAERVASGAEEQAGVAAGSEVVNSLAEFQAAMKDYETFVSSDPLAQTRRRKISLGDTSLFRMFIGKRVLVKDATGGGIPLYSANPLEPMGFIAKSNITDFTPHSLLWGIDGNFEFNLLSPGEEFATTDHCGTLQVVEPGIIPEYVLYALTFRRSEESFDRAFRAALDNMGRVDLEIPILPDGRFDVETQRTVAARFATAKEKRARLAGAKAALDAVFGRYIGSSGV
jgi:type I restriction enzyme M protein